MRPCVSLNRKKKKSPSSSWAKPGSFCAIGPGWAIWASQLECRNLPEGSRKKIKKKEEQVEEKLTTGLLPQRCDRSLSLPSVIVVPGPRFRCCRGPAEPRVACWLDRPYGWSPVWVPHAGNSLLLPLGLLAAAKGCFPFFQLAQTKL
jgi:hypothetical protein